jgi:hypothetical protein
MTSKGNEHVKRVKSVECARCDAPGPSEAYETIAGQRFSCVALCKSCLCDKAWTTNKTAVAKALHTTVHRVVCPKGRGHPKAFKRSAL